ncbi:peptidyl-tRNA hydrolase domain protein [Neofusicoccum parvum]|uniref:Peptidyl-tRNA hydrolase domain protein n=1 Tax=Neofusicoccum parvum TaxID=310453 RepID=A0ACB5RNB8_9PEZI|nr:peptidyl-tRNA hydrolase domain protein [Neofusicoccum parvum]GME34341.1 peptidyl-tRNA hydrolase domain protein [Neofusicoccum parvum]
MLPINGPVACLLRRLAPRHARPPAAAPPAAALQPGLMHRRALASRPRPPSAPEEDLAAARRWLQTLDPETIPKSICDVSFSRSSGPGGQNVNKVSSKATLRVPLDALLPLLPALLHQESDDSRKQTDNVHACFRKLHQLILDAGKTAVPGETSEEQKERVRKLEKAGNEARLKMKKVHSSKKSARKGGSPDY